MSEYSFTEELIFAIGRETKLHFRGGFSFLSAGETNVFPRRLAIKFFIDAVQSRRHEEPRNSSIPIYGVHHRPNQKEFLDTYDSGRSVTTESLFRLFFQKKLVRNLVRELCNYFPSEAVIISAHNAGGMPVFSILTDQICTGLENIANIIANYENDRFETKIAHTMANFISSNVVAEIKDHFTPKEVKIENAHIINTIVNFCDVERDCAFLRKINLIAGEIQNIDIQFLSEEAVFSLVRGAAFVAVMEMNEKLTRAFEYFATINRDEVRIDEDAARCYTEHFFDMLKQARMSSFREHGELIATMIMNVNAMCVQHLYEESKTDRTLILINFANKKLTEVLQRFRNLE